MKSSPLRLLISIILISHLSSLLVLLLIPSDAAHTLASVPGRIESLASLLGSFAFTMAGFLAAVLALFGVMSGSTVLANYQQRGYLSALLVTMGIAVVELVVTFGVAIRLFFIVPTQSYVDVLGWLVATDLIMLLFSTLPVVMLVKGTVESIRD